MTSTNKQNKKTFWASSSHDQPLIRTYRLVILCLLDPGHTHQTDHLRPEEGQSTLTETSARLTCLSHAGIREPNLSHDYASGEALA